MKTGYIVGLILCLPGFAVSLYYENLLAISAWIVWMLIGVAGLLFDRVS